MVTSAEAKKILHDGKNHTLTQKNGKTFLDNVEITGELKGFPSDLPENKSIVEKLLKKKQED